MNDTHTTGIDMVRVLTDDERGEVNVSTIGWMVIAALVIFGLLGPFNGLMTDALQFVRDTLGI